MDLWSMTPRDVRPVLRRERADLLELLSGLDDVQWRAPTQAPGWTAKDVALHLLDDDLGWLSRGRDGDDTGLLPVDDHETFVRSLAAKNQRWVDGAQGLSREVVIGLLAWAGEQVDAYYDGMDLAARGHVSWAGGDVPVWFDIEQDLTERWVHQQQIRRAVGVDAGYAARYLPLVLGTFVWAFPAQYRADAPQGTAVGLDLGAGPGWTLTRTSDAWVLDEGLPAEPAAVLRADAETSWRLLTGALGAADATPSLQVHGDRHLTGPLLRVRGIIV
jgi:uncharacterized protein (TIGR03083 family)